jgi:fumarate reductase flavoprotein subunit
VIEGPLHALGPMNGYVTLADGGRATDTQLPVISQDGQIIAGLWTTGSTRQGVCNCSTTVYTSD